MRSFLQPRKHPLSLADFEPGTRTVINETLQMCRSCVNWGLKIARCRVVIDDRDDVLGNMSSQYLVATGGEVRIVRENLSLRTFEYTGCVDEVSTISLDGLPGDEAE